jgi:hypothetical protein
MPKRLIYSVMAIASAAMLLFVVGFVFWQLGITILAGFIYWLAGKIILAAFVLLVMLGFAALLRALWRDLRAYFNSEARALRRLLAVHSHASTSRQCLQAQAQQVRFWTRIRRQRLLLANNRRHLRGLFRAINAELYASKPRLPTDRYQALRKALRDYHKRADADAMLALREQLPCQ